MATLGSLAVGAKIKVPHSVFGNIIFQKADKDHSGYPSNSTTLITEKIIKFACFDAIEPNNSNSDRKTYGNNKYSVSNIDQWLNSSAAVGQWYSAQHAADQAPDNAHVWNNYNEYDQDAGFLNGFDAAFVSALMDTTLKVALNTVTDGGSYESITRKMFLASKMEVFGQQENNISEGSVLSIFSANTNASRVAVASEYAASHSEYDRTAGTAYYWWLRTPNSSNSRNVRNVDSDGGLYNSGAYYGHHGVRPLCNLSSDISVSDSTDSDGCYTLNLGASGLASPTLAVANPIYCSPTYETGGLTGGTTTITWGEVSGADSYVLERSVNNGAFAQVYSGALRSYTETITSSYQSLQYRVKAVDSVGNTESEYATSIVYVVQDNFPPFISGDETNMGYKPTRFTYDYIIYDGDDQTITVKEYVNTTLLRTYTATAGQTNTLSFTSAQWGALSAGDNYIKIEVSDESATVTQTKHFTKSGGVLEVEYCPTGNTSVQPKSINVELDLEKPFISGLQVLVCNNGNDAQPVWDDMTTAVRAGVNHVFTNGAKQSGVTYWKVIIRIIVMRNDAEGDIKLKGVKVVLGETIA